MFNSRIHTHLLRFPFLLSVILACLLAVAASNRLQAAATKDTAATSSASKATDKTAGSADETSEQLQARIHELIQRLGSEKYLTRQAAQAELIRIGPDAFDSLIEAEAGSDVEIASHAQYLLQLIRIEWSHGNDGPEAKQILKNYDEQTEAGRFAKLRQLALLPGNQGVAPLCRLVRFEHLPRLSKHAALLIINQPNPKADAWAVRTKTIDSILANCTRPGAKWLHAYIQFQTDPAASAEEWKKLVDEELTPPDVNGGDVQQQLNFEVQHRLADTLARKFQSDSFPGRELSLSVMRKAIQRIPNDRQWVWGLVDWFVARQAWDLIDETAMRFEATFNGDPVLMESLAAARRGQGNIKGADEIMRQGGANHSRRSRRSLACGQTIQRTRAVRRSRTGISTGHRRGAERNHYRHPGTV